MFYLSYTAALLSRFKRAAACFRTPLTRGFCLVVLLFAVDPNHVFGQDHSADWPKQTPLESYYRLADYGYVYIGNDLYLSAHSFQKAFLQSVFSAHTPGVYGGYQFFCSPYAQLSRRYGNELSDFKKDQPWIAPYIDRDEGIPRIMALNKWTGPITISTQLPNDVKSFQGPWKSAQIGKKELIEPPYEGFDPEVEALIGDQVKALIPDLEEATGLPVEYIPHDEETRDHFANIRIVYRDYPGDDPHIGEGDDNKFEYEIFSTRFLVAPLKIRFDEVEICLDKPVYFTPNENFQVQGIFVANENNEIGLSLCYLWKGHTPEMVKALTKECVVRSLGFPLPIRRIPKEEGPPKEITIEDMQDFKFGGPDETYEFGETILSAWNEINKDSTASPLSNPQPETLSPIDKFLIRLLYDPSLKPGMGHKQAREKTQVLLNHKKKD